MPQIYHLLNWIIEKLAQALKRTVYNLTYIDFSIVQNSLETSIDTLNNIPRLSYAADLSFIIWYVA